MTKHKNISPAKNKNQTVSRTEQDQASQQEEFPSEEQESNAEEGLPSEEPESPPVDTSPSDLQSNYDIDMDVDQIARQELADEQHRELEAALEEEKDKTLRALAEMQNIRRRMEREKADASKYAITAFAREMIGVADNLQRALESIDKDNRADNQDLDALAVGLEMTQQSMLSAFSRAGIEVIEALGKKFDHNLHEALFEVEDPSSPPGTVVQVLETGYLLKERLLRPSKVGVAKGGKQTKAPESHQEENDSSSAPAASQKEQAYQNLNTDKGQTNRPKDGIGEKFDQTF